MSYFLTEEQEMLKELCAQIAREKILPVSSYSALTGRIFSRAIWAQSSFSISCSSVRK